METYQGMFLAGHIYLAATFVIFGLNGNRRTGNTCLTVGVVISIGAILTKNGWL